MRDYREGEYKNPPYSFNVAPTTIQMYKALNRDDYGWKASITFKAKRSAKHLGVSLLACVGRPDGRATEGSAELAHPPLFLLAR